MAGVVTSLQRLLDGCLDALTSRLTRWTKPLGTSLPMATLTDLGRNKSELISENALLRQQLIILKRQVKRPACTKTPATDHPQAAGETAGMHENRSPAPRPVGQAGSRLAASPHHSFNPTQCSASIGSSSACTGNTGQRLQLTSRRSLQKPWR